MHPRAGGPPVVVENFVRETRKLGHLPEIISTPLYCDGDQSTLLQRLNELAPTTFLPGWRSFDVLQRLARRQLAASIRSAEIVHVHTLWNPINIVVRRECARHQRPYVLMPHGMLDPYSLTIRRWRKAFYLWAMERRNLSNAQRLIYTTPEEVRLATMELSSLPRAVVIPLGGDAPCGNCYDLASAFFDRFPRARGRRQLLFFGRLHFKKGLDRILAILPSVVRVCPDVLLTIVGDGSPKFVTLLNRIISAQRLERNVLMTGRLEGAMKWGAYASAELFVLPSRQENFAITVAEAMQMGIPVIISNKVNTWPHVKEAGAGLIVDDGGIEVELEKALLSLLRDGAGARLMGRRGQEYARRNLTWTRATTCLMKCYDEVVAGWRRAY